MASSLIAAHAAPALGAESPHRLAAGARNGSRRPRPDQRPRSGGRGRARTELLSNGAKPGLEFTKARHAEAQAERGYEMAVSAHRLNLLMAAFFPVATLGTVFGMNVSQGLNNALTAPLLWVVLATGLMCGTVLAAMIARKPVRPARKARMAGAKVPIG